MKKILNIKNISLIKLSVTTIIFIVMVGSCKPEAKEDIIQYPINEELKSYLGNFKDGSWWVYKDTVSGRLDTFRLSNYGNDYKVDCYSEIDGKKVYGTYMSYVFNHNLTNYKKKTHVMIQSDCSIPNKTKVRMVFGAANGILEWFFIEKEGFLNEYVNSNNDTILTSFHSEFNLNDINYNDVYYIENTGESSSYSEYNYIISKNIGIIGFNSKNYFDDNWKAYWVLIDKKIVL